MPKENSTVESKENSIIVPKDCTVVPKSSSAVITKENWGLYPKFALLLCQRKCCTVLKDIVSQSALYPNLAQHKTYFCFLQQVCTCCQGSFSATWSPGVVKEALDLFWHLPCTFLSFTLLPCIIYIFIVLGILYIFYSFHILNLLRPKYIHWMAPGSTYHIYKDPPLSQTSQSEITRFQRDDALASILYSSSIGERCLVLYCILLLTCVVFQKFW